MGGERRKVGDVGWVVVAAGLVVVSGVGSTLRCTVPLPGASFGSVDVLVATRLTAG